LTAGTRRNGTSKFGPFQSADSLQYGEYGYAPYDDTSACADAGPFGDEEPTAAAVRVDHDGDAGHEREPSRNAGRYTGRHAGVRGKTTRRRRIGKVVPIAAVAAAVAAGAAAYGLSGGQPSTGHLNAAAAALPDVAASTAGSGAGNANGAAAAPIKIATATASPTAHAPKHAKTAPRRTPAATPSARVSSPARTASTPATRAAAPAATTAASSPATSKPATATTLSCNVSDGLLPENVTAIVSFLLAHGYSDNAAAGIAGNMYQESKGNPESEGDGGGGLIGWTPLPSGFVTGDVTADLQTQLNAVLTFNQGWSSYLPELNAAASPADAAYIYVTDFERAGIPAAATREAAAADVASACGI
jgi:Phage tail lysozyme